MIFQLENVATVAIGNPERHERKTSHCGNKQQCHTRHFFEALSFAVDPQTPECKFYR